jgi:Terminase large subunit, T4likevirus-type, N-terminal
MNPSHELAYRIDPPHWVRNILGIEPSPWQEDFLRTKLGAWIAVLTARQVGKTTVASWAIAHCMLYNPNSLSVVAAPSLRQGEEMLRRIRQVLITAGAGLVVDKVQAIELDNGSRVLALPENDDSIRGLTVDGWIVVDEAARVGEALIAALMPMRARKPDARFAMLSTAWSRTDPFWNVWSNGDPTWRRLKATADVPGLFDQKFLEHQRRTLGEPAYAREYLGVPVGTHTSPFTWDLYDRGVRVHTPVVQRNPSIGSRTYNTGDVMTWPLYKPIIAHDVGRSRDRSTAVVGGGHPYGGEQLGILAAHELPQNLFGSERANALAKIDQQFNCDCLIVADLSNDASYAEILLQTFGIRVIGLHISRYGNGMEAERRFTNYGSILVYKIGRTFLLEQFHTQLQGDLVRLGPSKEIRSGYEQLANLAVDFPEGGHTIYQCPVGHHDDLGISFAMLAWAARHPHLRSWMQHVAASRQPRRPRRPPFSSLGWT